MVRRTISLQLVGRSTIPPAALAKQMRLRRQQAVEPRPRTAAYGDNRYIPAADITDGIHVRRA